MIAKIHIDPADWPRSEGVLVDRHRGVAWEHVALYALRERDIEIEVEPGDKLRFAGFRKGIAPLNAPKGFDALLLSDYLEIPIG